MVLSTTASTARAWVLFISLGCLSLFFALHQAPISRLTPTLVSSLPAEVQVSEVVAVCFSQCYFLFFCVICLPFKQSHYFLSSILGFLDVHFRAKNRCVICEQHIFELKFFGLTVGLVSARYCACVSRNKGNCPFALGCSCYSLAEKFEQNGGRGASFP